LSLRLRDAEAAGIVLMATSAVENVFLRNTREGQVFGRIVLSLAWMLTALGFARAQVSDPLAELQLGVAGTGPEVTARLTADVTAIQPGKPFTAAVHFSVPSGTYFYYRTGGSFGLPTKVAFAAPPGFEVEPAQFPTPEIKYEQVGGELSVHYVYKKDTFISATITPPKDLQVGQSVELSAPVSFQFCLEDGACFPPKPETLKLTLPVVSEGTKPSDDASRIESARRAVPVPGDKSKYARVSAVLSQDRLRPGDRAELAVVIDVDKGYHIQMNQPPVKTLISTDVVVHEPDGIEKFVLPAYPPGDPIENAPQGFEGARELRGRVVVRVPVVATESLKGPATTFSGFVRYQACLDGGACFPPLAAAFSLVVPIASKNAPVAPTHQSIFASAPRASSGGNSPLPGLPIIPLGDDFFQNLQPNEGNSRSQTLPVYLLWAFLGGLILNIMPCVLPVIAIKVMSFVQQAGESRGHVFLLNVSYSAGVISVFLLLATLAVTLGLGWGGLFQKPEFNLFMAGLVFAMGLSLLGVFEIPVPGMIGSAAGAAQKEGPLGAFLTGILATLLATPCSGPFLGITLGWSVRQPPAVTYLIWGTMGLGMATPYLIFGLFPAALRWLPKPGTWMVRFKEFAGLILMGTVVWIITFLDETYTLPCLVMLVGLALGFWMIGNLYDINSHIKRKTTVRISAVVLSALICMFALTSVKSVAEYRRDLRVAGLREMIRKELGARAVADEPDQPNVHSTGTELPWQPFSDERLRSLLAERKTVLVDFTANW
jgi:thiol:disulfide interchange protein DsbD